MKQMLINLHRKPHGDITPQKKVQSPPAKAQSSSSVNLTLEREAENIFVPKPTLFVSTIKFFLMFCLDHGHSVIADSYSCQLQIGKFLEMLRWSQGGTSSS